MEAVILPARVILSEAKDPTKIPLILSEAKDPTKIPLILSEVNDPTKMPLSLSEVKDPTKVPLILSEVKDPTKIPLILSEVKDPTKIPLILSLSKDEPGRAKLGLAGPMVRQAHHERLESATPFHGSGGPRCPCTPFNDIRHEPDVILDIWRRSAACCAQNDIPSFVASRFTMTLPC